MGGTPPTVYLLMAETAHCRRHHTRNNCCCLPPCSYPAASNDLPPIPLRRASISCDAHTQSLHHKQTNRHALLLTDAALYLLEVEMLPTPLPQSQSPTDPESWAPVTAAPAAVGSTRHQPPGSGEAVAEKPKVKSIKMMDRLMPSELLRVSLPFREMTLRNGDVVAKRGCGIVLHTKVGGRVGNLWLKCRTNQDRGALVDALVPWSETSSPGKTELNVQQVRNERQGGGARGQGRGKGAGGT